MSEDDRKVRWAEMHSTGKISREIYEDQKSSKSGSAKTHLET